MTTATERVRNWQRGKDGSPIGFTEPMPSGVWRGWSSYTGVGASFDSQEQAEEYVVGSSREAALARRDAWLAAEALVRAEPR